MNINLGEILNYFHKIKNWISNRKLTERNEKWNQVVLKCVNIVFVIFDYFSFKDYNLGYILVKQKTQTNEFKFTTSIIVTLTV